jgi:hypothetical protein
MEKKAAEAAKKVAEQAEAVKKVVEKGKDVKDSSSIFAKANKLLKSAEEAGDYLEDIKNANKNKLAMLQVAMSFAVDFAIEEFSGPESFLWGEEEEKKLEMFFLDAEVFDADELDFEPDLEGM